MSSSNKRWRSRNPEKVRAHTVINDAVRAGRVIRPLHCQDCGAEAKLDGHHSDYSRPMDVEWLCDPCHRTRHPRSKSPQPRPTGRGLGWKKKYPALGPVACGLLNAGMTLPRVADEIGVSKGTVYKWFHDVPYK